MKVTQFEGTAEEFTSVAHLFSESMEEEEKSTNEITKEVEKTRDIEPKEAIRKMITRIPLRKRHKALFNAMAEGEIHLDELASKINLTPEQFRGVMGGLGRRISGTKEIKEAGLPENVTAVIFYRKTDDKWSVSLTADAKDVLIEEGIIN